MRSLLIAGLAGATLVSLPAGAGHAAVQATPAAASAPAAQPVNEKQKKIAEDSARLLKMANDLKVQVDKTTKDQMSLEVIRKADAIEKLAHDLKLRMKS